MQHSNHFHSAHLRRKKKSTSVAATKSFLIRLASYCCLTFLFALILPMNPATTRQKIVLFSKPLIAACDALIPNAQKILNPRTHNRWIAGSPIHLPSSHYSCSTFVHTVRRTRNNKHGSDAISGQQYSTRLLAAATSKARRSKSTYSKKGYSLVVKGPPGFSYPPQKDDRPFKLVIVESPSKCQTISKILQEYVDKNELEFDFVLTSSMGHIRDLPKKKTEKGQKIAGIDLDDDYRPTYVILDGKEGLLKELEEVSGYAQQLILATDDDREGEAMAWHLLELLGAGNKNHHHELPPIRVRFTEITKKAIVDAIENFEPNLRDNLVQAQETRRILDRLAGFTLSPVLAKKISPGLSAGRVQSVGMALTVQRERERLTFKETEYWSVKGNFSVVDSFSNGVDQNFLDAQLVSVNGQSLASGTADFDPKQAGQLAPGAENKLHLTEESASELTNLIATKGDSWLWNIQKITSTQRKNKAPLPFITSSLQQEANRRLGLSVSNCMRSAQQLYEKGFISYMRTDSMHLSEDARNAIQTEIVKDFGSEKYDPEVANVGSKKKNKKDDDQKPDPQAAHEAIRPAVQENGRFRKPENLPPVFDAAAIEVYRLIYQRTVASRMIPQLSNQTSITIMGESGNEEDIEVLFRTSGSVVIDPGYTEVYPRQVSSKSPILPSVEEGQCLDCVNVKGLAHVTQPPARYTEASFIQELEAKGVGRPSTYASIVQTLRYRSYIGSPVVSDSSRRGGGKEVSGPAISAQRAAGGEEFTGAQNARGPLVPSLSAFVVTSLLEQYCKMYVDPSFTAKMEERLDKIANSEVEVSHNERISYLNEFYKGENGLASKIDYIDNFVDADVARRAELPALEWNSTETEEDIGLFIGPWGPYLKKSFGTTDNSEEEKAVKAKLPPGMAADISTITLQGINAVLRTKEEDGVVLGQHPEDGRIIRLKVGPYGGYLQWGDDNDEIKKSTHTLPRELRNFKMPEKWAEDSDESLADMIGLDLEVAVKYCSLPRTVCMLDDSPIKASIGPYGPYLMYNKKYVSLKPKDGDVFTIEEMAARELVIDGIVNKNSKSAGALAEIGEKEGSMITVKSGRFGDYINWNKVNAKLPAEYFDDPSKLPVEDAWALIQEKAASTPRKTNKKKKDDLPPGPKRPKSSYLIFSAERRPEVSAKFSTLGDVAKELGRQWNELSEEDKRPYVEQAEIEKAAYEVEKKEWQEQTKQLRKARGKKSSPSGPKRPRSAYIFFCNAERAEVSKKFETLGEVSKELGRLWNNLDSNAKAHYESLAAEDKLRYNREKEELEDSLPSSLTSSTTASTSSVSTRSKPKKKSRSTTKVAKTEKKKRSPSAYMLFCASHRSQVVDKDGNKLSLPETTKILAQMWRECDEETRARFLEEADIRKKTLQ